MFSRLLKEVARRDEIIRKHLNNYKVGKKKKHEGGKDEKQYLNYFEKQPPERSYWANDRFKK